MQSHKYTNNFIDDDYEDIERNIVNICSHTGIGSFKNAKQQVQDKFGRNEGLVIEQTQNNAKTNHSQSMIRRISSGRQICNNKVHSYPMTNEEGDHDLPYRASNQVEELSSNEPAVSRSLIKYTFNKCEVVENSRDMLVYVRQLCHDNLNKLNLCWAWDKSCKSSDLEILPNAPNIVLSKTEDSTLLQSIRCRRFMTQGVHKWKIKRKSLFDNSNEKSDIFIGLVNHKHNKLKFDLDPPRVGENCWCWNPKNGILCHADESIETKAVFDQIDWHEGILCTLDFRKLELKFQLMGASFVIHLPSNCVGELYPYVLINCCDSMAVEIRFEAGEKEFVNDCVSFVEDLSRKSLSELAGFRSFQGMCRRNPSENVLAKKCRNEYHWGEKSDTIDINQANESEATYPLDSDKVEKTIFAGKCLEGNLHVFDILIQGWKEVTIGVVGRNFNKENALAHKSDIRTSKDSWVWNSQSQHLFYNGNSTGKFPIIEYDLWNKHVRGFRLSLLYDHKDKGSLSFGALLNSGTVNDLGTAFIGLPRFLTPVLGMITGDSSATATLLYRYGCLEFMKGLIGTTSKTCIII